MGGWMDDGWMVGLEDGITDGFMDAVGWKSEF